MFAGMAELADAHGSGPCELTLMRVQVPFPALYLYDEKLMGAVSHFFYKQSIWGQDVFNKVRIRKGR